MTDSIRYETRGHNRFDTLASFCRDGGIVVERWVPSPDDGGSEDGTVLAIFFGENAEAEAARYVKRLETLDTGRAVKAKYDALTTPEAQAERLAAKARRSPYGSQL